MEVEENETKIQEAIASGHINIAPAGSSFLLPSFVSPVTLCLFIFCVSLLACLSLEQARKRWNSARKVREQSSNMKLCSKQQKLVRKTERQEEAQGNLLHFFF